MQIEKIKIPDNVKSLRIDVGLSDGPPHASAWLREIEDVFVIGFEPVRHSFIASSKMLSQIPNSDKRYILYHCALDNVSEPTIATINVTHPNIGCSSLYWPKYGWKQKPRKIEKCDVVNINSILDKFPWGKNGIDHIDYLKMDTQGKDLDIFLSISEEHKKRIIFLKMETSIHDDYVTMSGENVIYEQDHVIKTILNSGFEIYEKCNDSYTRGIFVDWVFINSVFKKKLGLGDYSL